MSGSVPPPPDEPAGRGSSAPLATPNGSSGRGRYDRVPPHSLDAEVSVLGAAMLSRNAAGEAIEVLGPDDFYRNAHRVVFEGVVDLLSQGEPIDTVTLTDWLARRDRLDEVGGAAALHDLTAAVPTAANAGHYARLVREKALLRRLIDAGTAVAKLGFEATGDADSVVDHAESLIYEVAQTGTTSEYSRLGDLLNDSFARIEQLSEQRSEVTGLATGFDDLDRLTAGLQPQNLVILAARPSMGKCLSSARVTDVKTGEWVEIGELVQRGRDGEPVQIAALDDRGRLVPADVEGFHDNGVQPVFRLRTRSGRSIRATSNHPFLTWQGWRELRDLEPGQRIAAPRELPYFGDRPLAPAEVKRLGDRRDAPVPDVVFTLPREQVALFLSRLFATDGSAWVAEAHGYYGISYSSASVRLIRDVQHLLLRFGILTYVRERALEYRDGTSRAFELEIRDATNVARFLAEIGIFSKEEQCAKMLERIEGLDSDPLREVASSDVLWDEVVAVEPAGDDRVYDLTVPGLHNFVADDLIVHNSSLAVGMTQFVSARLNRPSIIFSLEMSKLEIVSRLLSSEARIDSSKLRTGQLDETDWRKLSDALGSLSEAPLFVDDTPSISLMEIRAKCRRLKQKHGLDLVVVDYLQLMQSHRRVDSRQQEVAEISRGLKMLAKELDVPVIALSQLSRQPESRTDKRPQLADLRESGCLTRGTRLFRADTGEPITFGELLDRDLRDVPVWSADAAGKLVAGRLTHAFPSGQKPAFRVRLRSGMSVEATGNHPFRTLRGWTALEELKVGSRVATARSLPEPAEPQHLDPDELVLLAHLLGEGTIVARQPVHYTSADPANLDVVEKAAFTRFGIRAVRRADGRSRRTTQLYLPAPYRLARGRRNPIAAWLDDLGCWDRRAIDKRIPPAIFGLGSDQVRTFLYHLWSTDGCLHVHRADRSGPRVSLYYATSSEGLAADLQLLLRCLGLHARTRRNEQSSGRDGYQVWIYGAEQQRRFLDTVGVHGARGDLVAEARAALDGVATNPNVDVLPLEVWDLVRALRRERGMSERRFQAALGMAYCGSTLYRSAPSRARLARVAEVLDADELRRLAGDDLLWDEIVAIEPLGEQPVFDATVDEHHCFVAEGVVLHNSIEQDADLVGFIYRDEVYDEDSPDKGIAELIISKHRNGATGIVRLAFLNHLTKFANLARGSSGGVGGGGAGGAPTPM